MEIKIKDLFGLLDILKEKLEDNFESIIKVEEEDFYWQISQEQLYNPIEEPKELTLGQLSDDWSELSRLLDKKEIPISYDLKRLSTIVELLYAKSKGKW